MAEDQRNLSISIFADVIQQQLPYMEVYLYTAIGTESRQLLPPFRPLGLIFLTELLKRLNMETTNEGTDKLLLLKIYRKNKSCCGLGSLSPLQEFTVVKISGASLYCKCIDLSR